jgi:undecaprenyl-diphosphatase
MPDWLAVVILGIVEGITEFLPVSSTGHLLIAEHWLGRRTDLFNVVIQAGAVLAVIPLFRRRLTMMLDWRNPVARDYAFKLFTAFVITGVGGVVLQKLDFKLPDTALPVGVALLVGGVLFVTVERMIAGRRGLSEVTWSIAVAVGIGQLVAAIFPGSSRSGTTILLCLLLGMARPAATEFSFLVGIPTMLAASGLKIYKALHHPPPGTVPENWANVAIGFAVAAVVSFIVVKWLLGYIRTHTFTPFGWYRIAVGVLILAFLR